MMPLLRCLVGIALRIVLAGACCLGIWRSWELARADYLFKKDNEESIRSAIRLAPDGWEYYMRLAQFDREHARDLLATSLRLDPYNAQANIELGLRYEADGEYGQAEKFLLAAYEVDHTYLPRWSLANYYYRRDNMPAFWQWARSAAAMPADDIGPLFELCWRASPDAEKVTQEVLNDKPEVIRQYIDFLLGKDQLNAVAAETANLVRTGRPEVDRPLLFSVVNRLVAGNDAGAANSLWRLLIDKRWVVAETAAPNNAEFAREPLPVSFDWSLPEYTGLHSWPGYSGLETEFTGSQPEECTIAEQIVILAPGSYEMNYVYHTTDIPAGTGIRWQVVDAKSNAVLAESSDLSSDAVQSPTMAFSVPQDAAIVRLRLGYRRALGTPRISGTLVVASTQIQAHAQP